MNIELAKELLSFHSCRNEDIDNPRWENGFLEFYVLSKES